MAIVMWFFVLLPAFLILLVLFLLSLPLHYHGSAHIGPRLRFAVQVRLWRLFRLDGVFVDGMITKSLTVLGYRIPIEDEPKKPKPAQEKDKEDKDKKDSKTKEKAKKPPLPGWTWDKLRVTASFIKTVARMVLPDKVSLRGHFGLSEPDLTAYTLLFVEWLGQARCVDVAVDPVWIEEACDLDLTIAGSFIPLVLIIKVAQYALSSTMRHHWLARIRQKRQPA